MDEEFLYAYREEPRESFRHELYERLMHLPANGHRRVRRWAWRSLAVFAFGLLLFLGLSPAARAQIVFVIHQIGGLVFVETNQVPNEVMSSGRIVEPMQVPLEEARQLVPYEFEVPTWAPDGFRLLKGKAHVSAVGEGNQAFTGPPEVGLRWMNDQARLIQMYIRPWPGGPPPSDPVELIQYGSKVGLGAVKRVEINGQPAALIQGSWVIEFDWRTGEPKSAGWQTGWSIELTWISEGLLYTLLADADMVSPEELVRMAESMR